MRIKSAIIGGLALVSFMGSAHATQFVTNGNFTQVAPAAPGDGQFDYVSTSSQESLVPFAVIYCDSPGRKA